MKTSEKILLRDGRTLGYAEYGDSKGKPLFFFHGWPNSRLHGEVLHTTAKRLGVRIISPDRPGYGISDFKKNRNILDWPDDVEDLANALHLKKFSILGNSGGRPYAIVCAYKIPERIIHVGVTVGLAPTNIEGILEGMAPLNKLGWRNYDRFPFLIHISSFLLWFKVTFLPKSIKMDFNSVSDMEVLRKVPTEVLVRKRKEAFRQGMRGPGHDLRLYAREYGFPIEGIKKNIYFWYGEKDQKVSLKMGKYYVSHIPSTKLTVFPNEGHMIIDTHTEEILKVLTS